MVKKKFSDQILNVLMNGTLVGQLEKTTSGYLTFRYEHEWLNLTSARPISLSLPLIKQKFEGDVVYHFFDNLLPDNPRLRSQIQAKLHAGSDQTFDLLAVIGKDCVGALQILKDESIPSFKKSIQFKDLSEKSIAQLLRNIKNNPLGMSDKNNDFRISLAGAQEKTALLFYQGGWKMPINTTPTTHIFKLPIGLIEHQGINLINSCENEWLCTQIAAAFGLPVAPCEIQYFEDKKALIVERFDRTLAKDGTWIIRLPQEDMCQALGLSSYLKYQSDGGPGINTIMQLLLGSVQANKDRDTFFRAQVLFWLLAAIDSHAKNFSIHIEPFGRYRLTPLYDIISAYPLMHTNELHEKKVKMAMALKGKSNHYHWHYAKYSHFLQTAKNANYSIIHAETILNNMLDEVDSVIELVSKKLPHNFPEYIAQSIFSGMQKFKKRMR